MIFPELLYTNTTVEYTQGRIIIPRNLSHAESDGFYSEYQAQMELMTLKAQLDDGEILISLINGNYDGDPFEEQIAVYRNMLEADNPVYITYIDYFETAREYRRVWTELIAATRPGTMSLYTLDLVGDHGTCVLISGLNNNGEQTLTVFRINHATGNNTPPLKKISEIIIEGSITVREVERSQAYQMGMARGQSFNITASGRDLNSANLMDRIETTYIFNDNTGVFEEGRVTRIPGAQIEQQRVREILGGARAFEEFVSGLWYYVSPQGTTDVRQFIYFDPLNREIIFYIAFSRLKNAKICFLW
jgi:hypothetical protein